MKNRDEMVNSLLMRRTQYIAEQKRKQSIFNRTIASMCCLCLMVVSCFGLWQNDAPGNKHPQSATDALYPGVKDTFDDLHGESSADKIIIHTVENFSGNKMNIALMMEDFTPMNLNELSTYYGYTIFPALSGHLIASENHRFGIYRRNGGSGAVYWDSNGIHYGNEDGSKQLHVEVRKDSLPLCDYVFYHSIKEKSVINGIEVAFGHSANGMYYAQFMHRRLGFQLVAQGLTQQEFVEVLSEMIR